MPTDEVPAASANPVMLVTHGSQLPSAVHERATTLARSGRSVSWVSLATAHPSEGVLAPGHHSDDILTHTVRPWDGLPLLRRVLAVRRWQGAAPVDRLRLALEHDTWVREHRTADTLLVLADDPLALDPVASRQAGPTRADPVTVLDGVLALDGLEGAVDSALQGDAAPLLRLLQQANAAGLAQQVPARGLEHVLHAWVVAGRAADVRALLAAVPDVQTPLRPALAAWSDLTLEAVTTQDVRAADIAAISAADIALGDHPEAEPVGSPGVRLATARMHLALELLLHRELHSDVESSPLVEDPAAYLAPLRASRVWQALTAPVPVRRHLPRVTTAGEESEQRVRPRVVILPGPYGRFHLPVTEALRADPLVRVRVAAPRHAGFSAHSLSLEPELLRLRLELGLGIAGIRRSLHPLLDTLTGADLVVADWAGKAAAIASWFLPTSTRLVLRVHGVDALRPWLHLVDWSRVDALVCVSDHMRRLVEDLLGERLAGTEVHVVPNAVDTMRFRPTPLGSPSAPADDLPGRTLVMVGWAQRVKDPLWTLELLAALRRSDPQWRLLLVGADFPATPTASGAAYTERFRARAQRPDVAPAIEYVGFTDALPDVLARAGFLISSSLREGWPVGSAEAVAAGCVPIVRDWPLFAPLDAARSIYGDWVVDSVEDAADRMLALAQEPERRRAADAARAALVPDPVALARDWRTITSGAHAQLAALSDSGDHDAALDIVQRILSAGAVDTVWDIALLRQAVISARMAGEITLELRVQTLLTHARPVREHLVRLRTTLGRYRETDPSWAPALPNPPVPRPDPVADRILHVLKVSMPHRQSGYALRSHYLLTAQREAGLDPVAVTAPDFPALREPEGTARGPLRLVPEVHAEIPHLRLVRDPVPRAEPFDRLLQEWAERLLEAAVDLRPSVIHAHSGHRGYETALVAAAVARALDVPFVYEVRGFLEAVWTTDPARAEHAEIYERRRQTEQRCLEAAAAVVTLSRSMAQDLVDRGVDARRIHLVPNGVDPAAFSPTHRHERLARHHRLGERFVFGYISNVDHYREAQELLVEAAALLRDRGVPATALIVGDGHRLEEVKARAAELGVEDLVVFTGQVPHEEVDAYYSLCDVFVVPRVDEQAARLVTPLKPYEAMARGIPLLVSDLPALAEIIGDGERGWTFRQGDAASMAAVLRDLYADPSSRRARAEVAHSWVLRERTWSANARIYREVYAGLAANGPTWPSCPGRGTDSSTPLARAETVLADVTGEREAPEA